MANRADDTDITLYVTGANAAYFPMLCVLLASFDRFAPGTPLHVCDFGLTVGQAAFLEAKGQLLTRPDNLNEGLHPYLYKGCVVDYVKPLEYTVLTWIDCDCVLTGRLVEAVDRLIAQHPKDQPFLCATTDVMYNHTLASFVASNPQNTAPFAQALAEHDTPQDNPYLSCGIYVIRCPSALQEWATLTRVVPSHFLFEQNIFNIVAYKHIPNITCLDAITFNVFGSYLNQLTVVAGGLYPGSIKLGEKEILVVHVSASDEQKAISFEHLILPVGTGFLCGLFRFPLHPKLNKFIMGLMIEYVISNASNKKCLEESGTLLAENPHVTYGDQFYKDPQYAHFFSMGNVASKP